MHTPPYTLTPFRHSRTLHRAPAKHTSTPPEQSNQPQRDKITYPYAITTAPSSSACLNVLYPLCLPTPYVRPGLSTANHSSKLRLMNGSKLNTGSKISETKDVTTAVNAFARLDIQVSTLLQMKFHLKHKYSCSEKECKGGWKEGRDADTT